MGFGVNRFHQRGMKAAVARSDIFAEWIKGESIAGLNSATRFRDENRTGQNIPGPVVESPVSIKPATGDVGQIQRRGTGAANRLGPVSHLSPGIHAAHLLRVIGREAG